MEVPTPAEQAMLPLIPPPPGVMPNFLHPQNQTKGAIALHTVCLFFVTVFLIIRLYTRTRIFKALEIDDFFLCFAYILTICFSGLSLAGDVRGLGRHLWDIPMIKLWPALKIMAFSEYVYMVLVPFIKISVLLFYRKLFGMKRSMALLIHGGILVIGIVYFILLFLTIFNCRPINKIWYPFAEGECFKPKILPWFSGAWNVVTDLYIFILPIPCILKLNMNKNRKLRLLSIFGLGGFACIASIIRLGMTQILYNSTDQTWNLARIEIWAVLEVNVGIMVACALSFPAFLDRCVPKLSKAYHDSKSKLLSSTTFRRRQETSKSKWSMSQSSGPNSIKVEKSFFIEASSNMDGKSHGTQITAGPRVNSSKGSFSEHSSSSDLEAQPLDTFATDRSTATSHM